MAEKAKHGTEALAGLTTAVLAVTAGFLVYVDAHPEPELRPTIVYLCLSLIPVVGLAVMYWTRAAADHAASAFDRPTQMLARCLFWLTLVGVMGTTLAFAEGLLPGQLRHTYLPVTSIEAFPWPVDNKEADVKEGEGAVHAFVYFVPTEHHLTTLPKTMTFDVELDKTVASSWQVASAWGYRLRPDSIEIDERSLQARFTQLRIEIHIPSSNRIPGTQMEFHWRDLQPEFAYLLEVRLKRIGDDVSADELINRIKEDRRNILKVKITYLRRHIR